MSSYPFRRRNGPIFVNAEVSGPFGVAVLKLVLDTGATRSLINLASLLSLGFDPDLASQRITMTTGSAVEVAPLLTVTRLSALGQHRFGFDVIAHALPESSAVDGLLGLDFFRDQILTIDFRAGQVTVS